MADEAVPRSTAAMSPKDTGSRPPWLTLGVLTLIYVFSFVDRKMPLILIESIKTDLQLSDTQIGLMTGIAFTLVYAIAGIPIAALAERYGRKKIICMCILFWSAFTSAGALAMNFWQLMISRMGVAVGEAGGTPASHSLIAHYFSDRRTTALAIFSMGAPVGAFIGMAAGGYLNDLTDWRTTLILVGGIPGIFIALLVMLVVKEPPRAPTEKKHDGMIAGVMTLLRIKTVRH